jgi:sugar O-acyltransferase (sialic acid O-acetyltransferase NeuD family)
MTAKPVVMFGNGPLAHTFHTFLTQDGDFDIVATTVDATHLGAPSALDLPTVPFEDVTRHYPPSEFDLFIALGYLRMNTVRRDRYLEAKEKGYDLISHVSPRASTWPDLKVGENCLILDEAIVHPFVTIGNDCIIWSGVHIGHHSTIADHCFIASRAALSGDVTVGERSFLGTNCTIRDGLAIAPASAIGAGVVITKDTVPGGVYAPPEPRQLPGTSDRLPRF